MARRRSVGIGVTEGGHKLVAHRHVEGRVGLHDGVELRGGAEHLVVFEAQEGEFVVLGGAPLPFVGGADTHIDHIEEARAVSPVGIQREGGRRGEAEAATMDAGEDEAREVEGQLRANLVGVEQPSALVAHARLPFVGAEDVKRDALATAEGVALGQSELHARAYLLVALEGGVHLKRTVVEFVHCGRYVDVERVAGFGGIARHIAHVHLAEYAERAQFFERGLLAAEAVEFSLAVVDGTAPYVGAQGNLFAAEGVGVVAAADGIVEDVALGGGIVVLAHADVGMADVPRVTHAFVRILVGLHAQLHIAAALERIGAIGDHFGRIVVETVLAEEVADARLLLAEVEHAEGFAPLERGEAAGGAEQAVHEGREAAVLDAVKAGERSRHDLVANLGLARVFLGQDRVVHAAAEVAEVVERVGGHAGTGFWRYVADAHGCGGKGAVYPFAHFCFAVHESVVEPEAHGEGDAVIG